MNDAAEYIDEPPANDRGPAYKVVATFGGLTHRTLHLYNGPNAQTDGRHIYAPFGDPFFYQYVEHELAHILFESNITAKQAFIASYLATTNDSLSKNQLKLLSDEQLMAFRDLISTIIGVLEDARVESLWGLLYPGSFELMKKMHVDQISHFVNAKHPATHRSLECFIVIFALSDGELKLEHGEYTRYGPVVKEALSKVRLRSFTATLAVTKWLVQKLVDEVLFAKRRPTGSPDWKKRASALAEKVLNKSGPPPPNEPDEPLAEVPLPPLPSEAQQRRAALDELTGSPNTLASLHAIANDWDKEAKPPSDYEKNLAKVMVESALGMKVSDEETLNEFLGRSEQKTMERVEEIRAALGKPEPDAWLHSNAFGKVNLKDVKGDASLFKLPPPDRATVERLRSIFFRVQGRRKFTLHEEGSAIDVPAYLDGLLSRQPVPCFAAEDRGRGFKVMVLLDRSSSMGGEKTEQAERACRVVSQALQFPFVDLHVWGFQSDKATTALDLTRFDRKSLTFTTPKSKVGGNTPLHLALRVVTRFLEPGNEAKQIFVISDGWPSYTTKAGPVNPDALKRFVRAEVQRARRLGISVTGIVIGKDMTDAGLRHMFGTPNNWRRMSTTRLGEGLVRVVSSSFTRYLRNG